MHLHSEIDPFVWGPLVKALKSTTSSRMTHCLYITHAGWLGWLKTMVRPRKSKGMMKPEQAFEQQRAGVVYKIGLRLSTISAVAG